MSKEDPAEVFIRRLRERVPDGEKRRTAELAGLSNAIFTRWFDGQRPPNPTLKTMQALASVLGVHLTELLTDDPLPVDESAFLTVPLLRDRAAAGQPRVVSSEVITQLPFTRYWLRKRLGVIPRAGRLVLIRVDKGWLGESMLPTIAPGSMLLVDRGPGGEGLTSIEDGRVYLLAIDDGLTVKRVYQVDHHLVACPDNTTADHRPFVVEMKGKRLQDVVKGRVIWVANQDV